MVRRVGIRFCNLLHFVPIFDYPLPRLQVLSVCAYIFEEHDEYDRVDKLDIPKGFHSNYEI